MSFEFFNGADMLGKIFWLCASAGTLFFSLRIIMMVIGGDIDSDMDGDFDMDGTDHAFEVLSINSITAFIMMFGWSGLTAYVQYALGNFQSVIIAFIVGIISMLFVAWLFDMAKKLVDRGAVFKLESVVGLNAQVYQEIPEEGVGKINVTTDKGVLKELDAVSEDKVKISSFVQVKIVKLWDGRTVSVQKI
ncbi:hypothetical protein MNBD_BACTEROID05-1102 [hydrothermal vent metagenome]|uniref:NfeD-like C-terminal domain-containing protein n=1 Tax=hydrothermal vent metagenome TaxID=652676 RepID=A0A3B0U5G6_9ZZZZ